MKQGRFVRLSLGAAVGFAFWIAAPSFAQDAAQAPAAAPAAQPKPTGVEEIIVTATKRAENLQEVPIAVSAFSGDDLAERGINEVEDLENVSPSIQINTSNSASNGGTVRIRGMGTTGNNPGLEAAVGTFIDGVYRSRSGQAFGDLLDIERVEVLRGPQGTLFGKNTSAGAVNVITKKPVLQEHEGFVQVEVGNYSHKRVAASYSAPIVDDILGFRMSANWTDRDGYMKDIHGGDAWADRDRYQLRGQLLWEPTENFSARLIADYGERDESCCPSQTLYEGPSSNRFPAATVFGGTAVGVDELAGLLGLGKDIIDIPLTATPAAGAYPFIRVPNSHLENREVGVNYAPFEDIVDWGTQLEINWDFEWATLTSITAWRDFHAKYGEDIDFTSADILRPQQDVDDIFKNFSQEVRFAGSWERLDWLVGYYGYTEDLHSDERLEFGTQAGAFVYGLGSPLVGTLPVGGGYGAVWNVDTSGYAFFTSETYHFTDRLSLTMGVRYSKETKQAKGILNGSPVAVKDGKSTGFIVGGQPSPLGLNDAVPGVPAGVGWCEDLTNLNLTVIRNVLRGFCDNPSWKNEKTEREWTGSGSLAFAVTDDINVYTTISRGYKAGGFNLDQESVDVVSIVGNGAAAVVNPAGGNIQTAPGVFGIQDDSHFGPEFATSYEVGIKGTYLNGMAVVNIAGFWTNFDDFQLNTFNGLGFTISNTDRVDSHGVELEMMLAPSDGIRITTGVTYADTRYGDVDLCFPHQYPDGATNACGPRGAGQGVGDVGAATSSFAHNGAFKDYYADGHRITNAPAWVGAMSFYGEHVLPSTEWMGYVSANVRYNGRHNTGSNLHPLKFEEAHWFLNTTVGVRSPEGHWEGSVWAQNLTDEFENSVVFDSVFQGGSQGTYFNAPRMYGATLKYNYSRGTLTSGRRAADKPRRAVASREGVSWRACRSALRCCRSWCPSTTSRPGCARSTSARRRRSSRSRGPSTSSCTSTMAAATTPSRSSRAWRRPTHACGWSSSRGTSGTRSRSPRGWTTPGATPRW
jgi:outer membrane receptor protein involved in Fe transport